MKKTALQPYLLATISGLLLAASWPTYGFPLLLFIAFVPLLFAEKKLRESKAPALKVLSVAYLCFVIWNLLTTWWLYYASGFGMWFAVLVNALLMSLVFLLYHWAAKRIAKGYSLVLFICLWLAFEKFHLEWEFSWPWLNLGHAFACFPKWIQWYEYTGSFGGSLWVLAINAAVFYEWSKSQIAAKKTVFLYLVLGIALPIGISWYIYNSYESVGPTKEVVLLQPNVDPYNEKYSTTNYTTTQELLTLAKPLCTPSTDYVIAPETVLAEMIPYEQFYQSTSPMLMRQFIQQYPNIHLLWGIDTFTFITNPAEVKPASNVFRPGIWIDFYNAALWVDATSEIQKYYKSKLVVGIENLPYKPILEPLLGNIMLDLGGTISTKTTQSDRAVFSSSDGSKVGPIICYESVYGNFVNGYVQNGAQFLAIITNDAWWNETQGHKQHLSFATLRAIETRRDIARSANTGISAFVNQKGEITQHTKYGEKIALKGTVQLNNTRTFYVQYGDYIASIALFIASILMMIVCIKPLRKKLQ
ncbi:MAG: apolipoprotein N-acyltransferase [Flavobacterium sp.]